MKRDYHLHTNYCKHSKFTVESLIEKALEDNFVEIGISEHIYASEQRDTSINNHDELLLFIEEVNQAKFNHKDKIKILCGLELEMVDQFSGEVVSELNNQLIKLPDIDYAIHSLHFYKDGRHLGDVDWDGAKANEIIEIYKKVASEQNVQYIAHPDLFLEGTKEFDSHCEKVAHAIGKIAAEKKIILGLNVNGISLERSYPSIEFWRIISLYDVKVKIELDAHSWKPFKKENIAKANTIAEAANLNIVEEIKWQQ